MYWDVNPPEVGVFQKHWSFLPPMSVNSAHKNCSSLRPNSLSSSIQWLSRTVIPNHCLIEFPWGTPPFLSMFPMIFL